HISGAKRPGTSALRLLVRDLLSIHQRPASSIIPPDCYPDGHTPTRDCTNQSGERAFPTAESLLECCPLVIRAAALASHVFSEDNRSIARESSDAFHRRGYQSRPEST